MEIHKKYGELASVLTCSSWLGAPFAFEAIISNCLTDLKRYGLVDGCQRVEEEEMECGVRVELPQGNNGEAKTVII